MSESLVQILLRCRTVLANMALENEGGGLFKSRWPINHEPLRADARGLVPIINQALDDHHQAFMAKPNIAREITLALIKDGHVRDQSFTAVVQLIADNLRAKP